jgi:hypothetical protein
VKLNRVITKRSSEDLADCPSKTEPRGKKPAASAKAGLPECFRRLKWNEVVSRGDFVMDEHRGFEPWEGPGGFRANAFLKPIYRRSESRLTAIKKPK